VHRGNGEPRPATFLLVKGRASLGNRILSALTGILYARLTGRRLLVDWRDEVYSDDGTGLRLERPLGAVPRNSPTATFEDDEDPPLDAAWLVEPVEHTRGQRTLWWPLPRGADPQRRRAELDGSSVGAAPRNY
jgi:hypothetical protein